MPLHTLPATIGVLRSLALPLLSISTETSKLPLSSVTRGQCSALADCTAMCELNAPHCPLNSAHISGPLHFSLHCPAVPVFEPRSSIVIDADGSGRSSGALFKALVLARYLVFARLMMVTNQEATPSFS